MESVIEHGRLMLGDVGTSFAHTLKDQDGNYVDVATAQSRVMTFSRPDSSSFVRNPIPTGRPGEVEYVTQPGDINQTGVWKVQTRVVLAGGEGPFSSPVRTFQVWASL